MFSKQTRDAARDHGDAADFISITAGESMQFRLLKVGEVRTVNGQNGEWQCLPMEIDCRWKSDSNNVRSQPTGYRWEPPADKAAGLIAIHDKLVEQTGNQTEICNHDVLVRVTSRVNPRTRRTFHVYEYELVAGGAAAPAPAAPAQPAPSRPGGPASAVDQLRAQLNDCADMDELKSVTYALWPQIKAENASAVATGVVRDARVAIAKRIFDRCRDAVSLQAAYDPIHAAVQSDPAALTKIDDAYRAAEAKFNAPGYPAGTSADPFEDIPF